MKVLITLLLPLALAGCATDPALVDPDAFRADTQVKVTRVVSLPAEIAASNLNRGAVKCWESSDIRVKQFQEVGRTVVTIGMYGHSQRVILFMADITPTGAQQAAVTVHHRHAGELHQRYAQNIAGWADNSVSQCDSPISR